MLNRVCKELIRMLREAIAEIREHNMDYHHITRPETIKPWEDFIAKVEKSL